MWRCLCSISAKTAIRGEYLKPTNRATHIVLLLSLNEIQSLKNRSAIKKKKWAKKLEKFQRFTVLFFKFEIKFFDNFYRLMGGIV